MSDNPKNGDRTKPISTNSQSLIIAGHSTRFGANWSGCRCSAKTRAGTPCQKPAIKGKARCQLHGGRSTGPLTQGGRLKIAAAHTKHGQRTNVKLAQARERARRNRETNLALRLQINVMIEQGYLPKSWKP